MQMLYSLTDIVAVSLSLTLLIFPHCFLSETLTLLGLYSVTMLRQHCVLSQTLIILGLYSVTDIVTSGMCSVTDTDAFGIVFCYRHCYIRIVFCHRHGCSWDCILLKTLVRQHCVLSQTLMLLYVVSDIFVRTISAADIVTK